MVSLTLSAIDFGDMEAFLAAAHKRHYPKGSTIIYACEDSDSIYYITNGSVTVLIANDYCPELIVAYLDKVT